GQRRMALVMALLIIGALVCGCDRRAPAVPTTQIVVEPSFRMEVKPLTPLVPGRQTHITVDPLSNVYWVQEVPDFSDDTLFVIGDEGVPRATQLSSASIAAALNAPGGKGHIHGIAAGATGEIYFYFFGSRDRQSLAAVGRYTPKNGAIQILADTK